jgi:dehydrogenase/reductase SDR family member 1
MNKELKNVIALVTGGSKGVGRGITLGLAEYGATIYITGRNTEELEKTAVLAEKLGGICIPIKCDHNKDDETKAVFEKIKNEQNALSLLVNCVWGGYEDMVENGQFTWVNKFWEQPTKRWDKIFAIGVRSIFVNSKNAMALMMPQNEGLIVNISFWAAQKYVGNVIYGASKVVADKLTSDMATELGKTDISVISLYPGLVRTEEVMKIAQYLDMTNSESPQFIGRVISKLYLDPLRKQYSGKVCIAAALAEVYDIEDIDGKRPKPLTIEKV